MEFNLLKYNKLDSTNKKAMELIGKQEVSEGCVILAFEQSNGRGQGKNFWESEKGKNLTFSLAIQPFFIEPEKQFIITQLVSVALIRTLNRFVKDVEVKVKWPNDIYAGDKKLAGILIQNVLMGNKIDYSVIGIGLNINQERFYSDAPNPVSMIHLNKKEIEIEEVLSRILSEFDLIYTRMKDEIYAEELNREYLKHLYKVEEWAKYKIGKNIVEGKILGVGEFGRLQIELRDNLVKEFDHGEIQLANMKK